LFIIYYFYLNLLSYLIIVTCTAYDENVGLPAFLESDL
jgi:hypothetical protein